MNLENVKFIVKEIHLLSVTYWRKIPLEDVKKQTQAHVFTWEQLTENDKAYLKENKKYTRIIPVGGLNAAH